jgi:hypothetical protein|tara:strand:+ start:1445 stop:1678 length:234 start_codon:yes stop_codon:yes gene_type:complete
MDEKEKSVKIMHNEKEYKFLVSDLSNESRAQYQRANSLGLSCMQLEQDLMEKRFLVNNYVSFVTSELDKEVDDKEEK